MSEMYLKPSQTSKMKVLAKAAFRYVFRRVFSIQNVFRTNSERTKMDLFTKIMHG